MAKVLNIPAILSSLSLSCTTVEHGKGKDQWQIFLIIRIYNFEIWAFAKFIMDFKFLFWDKLWFQM
jgi:hypothetical protein